MHTDYVCTHNRHRLHPCIIYLKMLKNDDHEVIIYKVLIMENKDVNTTKATAHGIWSLNAGNSF